MQFNCYIEWTYELLLQEGWIDTRRLLVKSLFRLQLWKPLGMIWKGKLKVPTLKNELRIWEHAQFIHAANFFSLISILFHWFRLSESEFRTSGFIFTLSASRSGNQCSKSVKFLWTHKWVYSLQLSSFYDHSWFVNFKRK